MKDRAHYIQWSASQPCLRPAPESRLCGYLWRRRWLGQWIKQLFIIRQDVLLVRHPDDSRLATPAGGGANRRRHHPAAETRSV